MGKEEIEKIKTIFSKLKLNPTYLEHKEVLTSVDAAKTRGFELKQGIKALLFTDEKNWVIVDVPAEIPTTLPVVEPTVVLLLLLLQFPPMLASANVMFNPAQTSIVPVINNGSGLTVIVVAV